MKLQIPLVPLLAVLNLASGPASASCGSNNPPEEALEAARSLDIDRQSTGMQVRSALHNSPREGFVIPTYLHVVESKEKAGLVTDKMLHDQDELNVFFESGLMTGDKSTGLCTFPVKDPVKTGEDGTPWAILDGCHVNPGALPGGAGQP
ncbi:hypothetical protein FOXYS1_849 [Fusarium oxysporum]|uniref:Uncharacterized protein n=1 Tax=Fusarium oxysporum TaxID=5507 RepID=A0A8H5EPR4_FUSOX|nr:hypothetical protein FOXYS1_849 [Fusarium oxysporum]